MESAEKGPDLRRPQVVFHARGSESHKTTSSNWIEITPGCKHQIILNPSSDGQARESSLVLQISMPAKDSDAFLTPPEEITSTARMGFNLDTLVERSPDGLDQTKGVHLTVGRDPDSDLVVPANYQGVSRTHADIVLWTQPGKLSFKVEDLSLNGTSVVQIPVGT